MSRSEKSAVMLELVHDWQSSGMGQVEYAREHNVSIVKFRYWLRKVKESGVHPVDTGLGGSFIRLGTGLSSGHIRLRYPNGVELTLPGDTGVMMLKNLINL